MKPPRACKRRMTRFKPPPLQSIFKIINNAAPFVHKATKLFLRRLATVAEFAAVCIVSNFVAVWEGTYEFMKLTVAEIPNAEVQMFTFDLLTGVIEQ